MHDPKKKDGQNVRLSLQVCFAFLQRIKHHFLVRHAHGQKMI